MCGCAPVCVGVGGCAEGALVLYVSGCAWVSMWVRVSVYVLTSANTHLSARCLAEMERKPAVRTAPAPSTS